MSPKLIDAAIHTILASGSLSEGERRLLERLRAVRDALWRNTLRIAPLMGKKPQEMHLEINIGVPHPETVNKQAVLAVAPYGNGVVNVVDGGLEIANDEGTDSTILAHALVVVSLDV